MDTTDKTDKIESKSNESEQQSNEPEKSEAELFEELVKKGEEIGKPRGEVRQDWEDTKEAMLKGFKFENDKQLAKAVYDRLYVNYIKLKQSYKETYKEYADYSYRTDEELKKRYSEEDYLVPGLGIERGQIIEFYGLPGAGKTFLSSEMAYKMSIGGWILNTPEYAVTKPLKVLYVDNENGKELIKRLNKMKLYKQELVADNLRILSLGNIGKKSIETPDIPMSLGKDPKRNEKTLADVIIGIARVGNFKPDVVYLDPLINLMIGKENDATDMGFFVQDIERITSQLGATVIINHHPKKESKENGKENVYDSRGSSVLAGALHMAVELKKESKEEEQKPDDNEEENDEEETKPITKPIIVSYNVRKSRGSSDIKSFKFGIFDSPLEELIVESLSKSIDGVSSQKENGVLVAKIYKDKKKKNNENEEDDENEEDSKKSGGLPTAVTLNMAEMIALMYKKGFDPVTISNEDYQEKIYSSFKAIRKYSKHMKRVDKAHTKLNQLIDKFIKKSNDDNKNKEEKDSSDNEKTIDPFV